MAKGRRDKPKKRDPHEQHLSTRQKRKRRIEKAKNNESRAAPRKKPAGLTPPVDVPDSNNVPAVGQAFQP